MEDARQTISSMQRIAELGRIEELVNRSLAQFEELRKVGTKLSRAAEIELQKKQQQLEYDAIQRKKEDEQARRRKDAETQKLLRMELERKKMEEEQRKREVAAQLRAKERAREREREKLEREKAIERARKQKLNNPNAPTYSGSNSSRSSNKPTYSGSASGSRSTSSYMDPKASLSPVPRKQEFSFDFLQKVAAGGPKAMNGSDDRGKGDRNGSGTASSASSSASRMAAVERLKVNRGYSPERPISNAQALGSKIMKRPPVKRGTGPRSPFPAFKSPGAAVNPIREAGLKAIRDGPIALNTKKRDLRSIEEITADINSHSVDARKEERARRMRAIEDEREKQRLQREKAIQAAKFSRSLMGDNVDETDRLRKEIDHDDQNGNKASSRRGRSLSYSRSPSPRRKRSKSPVRRRRSKSPTTKRSYSPDPRKRSLSPPPRKRSLSPPSRKRRSPSPPIKKKVNRDLDDRDRDRDRDRGRDRDRDRERERERDRDRDRATGSKQAAKRPGYGGSSKRQVSRTPSPPRKKRAGSPRGNGRKRGPFEEDLSVSSVIGALFGTRYRAKAEDEDLSDDMEARPDEVFREEARSARIARKEDEMEAELERAQAERARKRKLERERNRS
ncbi:hypothetical protein BGZ74_007869 [Mortierella antarctica]|nr:hypothetical protein BGZ74_007869 [Mortierella antarctica]